MLTHFTWNSKFAELGKVWEFLNLFLRRSNMTQNFHEKYCHSLLNKQIKSIVAEVHLFLFYIFSKMFQLEMKHECRQEHHPYRIRKNVGMSLGLHIPLHQFHKNEFPPINPWRVQGLWISRIILIAGLFHRFSKLKPPVSPHLRLSLFADLGLKEGCKVFLCE